MTTKIALYTAEKKPAVNLGAAFHFTQFYLSPGLAIWSDGSMAGAERESHGKNQGEPGIPSRSHWARDTRSLMQSFLKLFEHSS